MRPILPSFPPPQDQRTAIALSPQRAQAGDSIGIEPGRKRGVVALGSAGLVEVGARRRVAGDRPRPRVGDQRVSIRGARVALGVVGSVSAGARALELLELVPCGFFVGQVYGPLDIHHGAARRGVAELQRAALGWVSS
jgi:hypothetical protein